MQPDMQPDKPKPTPPGPPERSRELVATLRYGAQMFSDPLGFVGKRFERYGDLYYAPSGGVGLYVVRRPEHAREVLVERADAFAKTHTALEALSDVLGSGLLTSDGDVWRRHRRLANPAFARRAVEGYAQSMIEESRASADRIVAGQRFDAAELMTDLTLRVVGRTLFGTDVAGDVERIGGAMRIFQILLAVPRSLPGVLGRLVRGRVARAKGELDELVDRLIAERTRAPKSPPDLAQMLIDAMQPDESGARLDAREVKDEILTFLLAGHETTSNTLAWAIYVLSQNPAVEARVRDELATVLAGLEPSPADLEKLVVTEALVKETLRLYPPAYVVARRAIRDAEIGGYEVPTGSEVIVWIYYTHRDRVAYPEPEALRLDRYLPDASGVVPRLPRGAWIPFGAGPRACIGRSFAMAEAVAALATLLGRWRFRYVGRKPPRLSARITLAPGGGVPVVAERATS
jgi:cytochrome P450